MGEGTGRTEGTQESGFLLRTGQLLASSEHGGHAPAQVSWDLSGCTWLERGQQGGWGVASACVLVSLTGSSQQGERRVGIAWTCLDSQSSGIRSLRNLRIRLSHLGLEREASQHLGLRRWQEAQGDLVPCLVASAPWAHPDQRPSRQGMGGRSVDPCPTRRGGGL